MGIEIGAAKAGKVLEAADYSAIGEAFEVGAAHVGDEGRVGAKGTHGKAGIVGVGQYVDNWHEVHIQAQICQVGSGGVACIIGYGRVICRTYCLFGGAFSRNLAQFIDEAAFVVGGDEEWNGR